VADEDGDPDWRVLLVVAVVVFTVALAVGLGAF
jgi:hypothetical protein